MFAEFKHTLRRLRGQMIGWGIGLALYSLMMVSFYESVAGMGDLQEFLSNYPEEMLAFFKGIMELNTPPGYLDTYYFNYMTIIAGIFAVGACAGLLAGDEEKGMLDLVMAHPISRSALFWGRLLGFAAATAVILLAGWLGWVLPPGSSDLGLSWLEFLRPCLPLFAVLVLFGALALLLGMLLPASRMASMLGCPAGGQLPPAGAGQHERRPQTGGPADAAALLPGRLCGDGRELGPAGRAAGGGTAPGPWRLGPVPAARHPCGR